MSHFSRIKTRISNEKLLSKTLNDLGFQYEYKQRELNSKQKCDRKDIVGIKDNIQIFEFMWDGQEYALIVDLQFWTLSISYDKFLDKVMQKYSYNSIIEESLKQGFKKVNQEFSQDGSIRLVIQRWC